MKGLDIGFERVDHLIALSALPKRNLLWTNYPISEHVLNLKFSNYVKSQVHLNVVDDLCGRSLSSCVNALRYLKGSTQYHSYAIKALRNFYSDMSRFLINNPKDVVLNIDVDVDLGLPVHFYSLSDVKKEIKEITVLGSDSDTEKLREFLNSSKYANVIDFSDGSDILVKLNSYSIAAILDREAKNNLEDLAVVKIGGHDEN